MEKEPVDKNRRIWIGVGGIATAASVGGFLYKLLGGKPQTDKTDLDAFALKELKANAETEASPDCPSTEGKLDARFSMLPQAPKTFWCWAAVAASVGNYFGKRDGLTGGALSMNSIASALGIQTDETHTLTDALCVGAGIPTIQDEIEDLNPDSLKNLFLDVQKQIVTGSGNTHPVCCRFEIGTDSKHFSVIIGWKEAICTDKSGKPSINRAVWISDPMFSSIGTFDLPLDFDDLALGSGDQMYFGYAAELKALYWTKDAT